MGSLTVMSYNLHDFLDSTSALHHVIRAADPDILCAQEVPRRMFSQLRAKKLARRTGLVWVCGGRGTGGTAVFVKPELTVLTHSSVRLPVGRWWRRSRGYAAATVLGPSGLSLVVLSVHLGLDPGQRSQHLRQIQAAVEAKTQWVIAGDFNETSAGDCWRALAAQSGSVSASGPTFPARNPAREIDAIFCVGLDLESIPVLGCTESQFCQASDHRPIMVRLSAQPAVAIRG